MAIVNILFLSDLHFTRSDASLAIVLQECANAYIKKMEELDDMWKPQIVAIAGDIGYRGAEDDYQFFTDAFFTSLLETLKINPDHVVACPGNHDKDDSRLPDREENTWKTTSNIEEHAKKYFFKWYRATCNEQRFIMDDFAITPFQNYISFLIKNGVKPFDTSIFDYTTVGNAEYLYGHRRIDGIDFYCYNSAWDCLHDDKQDKGNLRIGPVSRNIEEKPNNSFAISMVHHPQDWLSVENISSALFRREQIAYQKDIAINGHMHHESFGWDKKCRVLNIQLPTWLSTDTDRKLWQSYIVRIDLEKMTYDMMSIFWRKNIDDNNIHPVTDIVSTSSDLQVLKKLEEERKKLAEERNNN